MIDRDEYKYLFPFEKINKGSKILIYGAGELGQAYWRQIQLTNYCEILGFVDRSYDQYSHLGIPVFSPEGINDIEFDYILLAFRAGDFAIDVSKNLIKAGVKEEKIVYIGIRQGIVEGIPSSGGDLIDDSNCAFNKECISIALRYGTGLGDAVIKLGFFNELASFSDNVLIDIYSAKAREFIDYFYSDCAAYNKGINDGGGLYIKEQKKYDVAISVTFIPRIDYLNENVANKSSVFYEKIMKFKQSLDEYSLEEFPFRNYGTHIRRMMYKNRNCYTCYNYIDDINVDISKIAIPMHGDDKKTLNKYGLSKYITMNYGSGMSSSGNRGSISKQWPKEYFEKFVRLFKKEYQDIDIVQLDDASGEKIEGVDKCMFGESMDVVEHILMHSVFHLDTEGALVHLASQLGTKCIVIFGPTQVDYFGYPSNINIVSDKCHGCYGLYDVIYSCARDMDKPECMWSITPEMVMEHVKEFMDSNIDNHNWNE